MRKEVRESEKVREMEAAKRQTQADGDSCLPERKSSFDVAKKCKNKFAYATTVIRSSLFL